MSDLIKTLTILNSKDCLALSPKPMSQKIKTGTAMIGENITIRKVIQPINGD